MHLSRPITAQIEITDVCNFRCKHCYLLDSVEHHVSSTSNSERLMKIAEILCDEGIFNIVLTGGEPLARPDILKRLIVYLTARGINVSVNTNLTLLTDELLDFFKEKNVRNLLISCPSASPSLYEEITNYHNYNRFMANLKKVIDSGVRYSLNMVVSQYNKHNIIETAKALKHIGACKFGATPMSLNPLYPRTDLLLTNDEVRSLAQDLLWIKDNMGMSIDIMEALPKCVFPKEMLKQDLPFLKRRCQAGISIIAVSHSGDVRPCTHNPEVYGNILTDGMDVIWQRMKPWRSTQLIPAKCRACMYFVSCHGGCRTNAKTFFGKWDAEDVWMEDPICERLLSEKKVRVDIDRPVNVVRLKTRKEGDYILICGDTSRQVAVVNDEVNRLLAFIKKRSGITIREIAQENDIDVNDRRFLDIIAYLLRHRIIVY